MNLCFLIGKGSMRKINLLVLFYVCIFLVHGNEFFQYPKEIDPDKNIAPHEIIESAVEEAIICLQQLQGRLMEAVVHRWAETLKEYFEKLLSNRVDMQIYPDGEELPSKEQLIDLEKISTQEILDKIVQLQDYISALEERIKLLECSLV